MEIKASAKYIRASPRKLRLLTKNLTGFLAQKALEDLEFHPQKGSEVLIKVIKQAMANAQNYKLSKDNFFIKTIEIGDGPGLKRMDKSHGARFDRGLIKKRSAHVFLTLETRKPSDSEGKGKALEVKEKIDDKSLEEGKGGTKS